MGGMGSGVELSGLRCVDLACASLEKDEIQASRKGWRLWCRVWLWLLLS